jgi:hypothetical protein
MVNFHPSFSDISSLISRSSQVVDIFSPYITEGPLDLLARTLNSSVELNVWTRLSPSDWSQGASDPEFLALTLDELASGRKVSLRINQQLHAKAYFSDRNFGLLGSANFTDGGFGRNIEVLLPLEGPAAGDAFRGLSKRLDTSPVLAISDLTQWVETHRSRVEQSREEHRDLANELADAQRDLDRHLGYGVARDTTIANEPSIHMMEEFIGWLRENRHLRESEMVVRRYENYQFLSGKAKQSICSIYRFLQESSEFIDELCEEATKSGGRTLYAPSFELREKWVSHLDKHAQDIGECYDYSVLRGYLTPNLGGTLTGGSGGESTFKRVLPLVAAFIKARRM